MRASRSALMFTYEAAGARSTAARAAWMNRMTKIVVVEEAVHVGAKDAA